MVDQSNISPTGGTAEFRLLKEGEAAQRLGISRRSLQQYRLDGKGPEYIQIMDRRIVYSVESLMVWAAGKGRKSTSDQGTST